MTEFEEILKQKLSERELLVYKHSNNWLKMHHYPKYSRKYKNSLSIRVLLTCIFDYVEDSITELLSSSLEENTFFNEFAEIKEIEKNENDIRRNYRTLPEYCRRLVP